MSKELVIGSNRHETKVAILEDDQLVELYFQRSNEYSLAGSIHKGRVTRVLPGMQSAFVDLGLERDTFLYVTDFFEENEDIDTVSDEKPVRDERRDRQPRIAQRPVEDRITEAKEFRPAVVETLPVEPSPITPEPDPALLQSPIAAEPTDSRRIGSRPEGDRNSNDRNFGGERRNKRSRRRRPRPNGIPENKYAQPNAVAETSVTRPSPFIQDDIQPDAADVMILPGESLAKYRGTGVSTARDLRPAPSASQFVASTSEPEHPYEIVPTRDAEFGDDASLASRFGSLSEEQLDDDEQEAIEEEAAEIELSDKVFSHREDDSLEAEEEKIEEVRNDTPAIPEQDVLGRAETVTFEPTPVVEPPTRSANLPELENPPDREADNIGSFAESESPEGEAIEANEFTAIASEEIAAEHAQALAEELIGNAEFRSPLESEPLGPQSASVRDEGGRVMHRASRRLRRRRGGNRMERGPSLEAGAGPSADSILTSSGGAVPALEPEPRREVFEERATEKQDRVIPSISDLLKAGQEIIVQIAKEPLGQKGARITSHIALPGRYVVFMPSVSHLGVSRKVASDEERQRLKRILQTHRVGTTGGFIVRTAGEGVPEEEIAADMNFLYTLWLDIRQKAEKKPAPMLLHYDLDVVQRILRDQITEEYKAIWVDNEEMYENVLNFMQRFQPNLVNRVKMYTRPAPIFDAFNITQELEKALRPKVWLKSGGYIVINQTEALVAIDINTGKYVGKSNRLEDTIVKTNTEAVKEIVRQIRLRDLGGIIVVDFIDMDERKNRQKVMQALEDAMRSDKAPYKILQFNDFGLVAITRKRVKQSLERTMCAPCPYCDGAGYVKSVQTVISEILVEAQKIARAVDGKDVILRVHPEVAKILKASSNRYLEELEETLGRPVLVTGDATVHHEKFDLA